MVVNELVNKAKDLIQQEIPDYEKAYLLLQEAHQQGCGEATYALATWYLHGQYLTKDIVKGTHWLKEAAKKNWADALYDLAISYEGGICVKK